VHALRRGEPPRLCAPPGVRTPVYFEDKKFKQKMSFADKSGIPFA
jgi:histidyl-tRNA synthetase